MSDTGLNRRDWFRIGGITAGASLLPNVPALASSAAKADSVIFLWMAGGVTHIDSFDPKPDAPVEVRGELTDMATSVPGIRFCETMPQLAKIAHKLAVVRSFSHSSNDHLLSQVYTLSGCKVDMTQLYSEPNIGSIINRLQGPRNGLPGYIAVPGITRPGPPPYNFFVGGWLGNQHAPYCVGGLPAEPDFTVGEKLDDPPSEVEENLTPKSLDITASDLKGRFRNRVGLRNKLDSTLRKWESPQMTTVESKYRDAVRLLQSPQVREAFSIDKEPDRIRDMYGRTKIGGRCLMARRLVEAGARFVMVDYGYDPDYGNIWDNHNAASQNHPPIQKMVRRGYHLAGMDKAFAGLINDLEVRGRLDSTLVVFLTEFGRTPNINANGGRDHWGAAGSIFFTGAKTPVGQVIGKTDSKAAKPLTTPYGPADIAATIYNKLGINHEGFVDDILRRPRPILPNGKLIKEVL